MNRGGFTLIEVVAAVAIAALILTATYGVVTTTLTSQKHTEQVLGVYKEGAAILTLVCEDLRCALYRADVENFSVRTETEFPVFHFASLAWDPQGGGRTPGEVGYELERGGDRLRLFRRFAEIEGDLSKGGKYTLVSDDITSWKVEYFDGKDWREDWEDGKSLPLAVGVEFTLEENERKPVRFHRRAAVPASNLAEPVTIPEAPGEGSE